MDLLKYLLIFLILIFPIAEVGKFQVGSVSITLNDIFVFIIAFVWFLKNKNFKKIKGDLKKPVFLFIFIGLLSLIVNILNLNFSAFFVSLLYLIRWILYSTIYFVLVSQDKKFIKKFSDFLLIPITLVLLFGYIQFIFYQNLRNLFYLGWDEHLYRLFSSFLDPNFAGAFLVISLIFLIYKTMESIKDKNNLKIYFISTLSFLNFLAIYLTYSRSALIMLLVSLITFLIITKRKKLLLVLLIPLVAFIFLSPKSFQTEGTNLLRIASSEARIQSAAVALDIIQKHPVLGVGFNAYRYAQNKYANLTDTKWEVTHSGAGTDNSFLFVLATTGVVGLTAYIYLIYRIFMLGKNNLKKNFFAAVLIASLSGLLVNSLFINSLFYVYIMEWIWILASLTENS